MVRTALLFPLVLFGACDGSPAGSAEASVLGVMADQQEAWNRGDVRGFMEGYIDTVCFIGGSGTTCGKEAVTANYLRRYPDRAAMGELRFTVGEVLPAGAGHAWTTGVWTLYREADTLSGGFTLLWVQGNEGWRIARDHTY